MNNFEKIKSILKGIFFEYGFYILLVFSIIFFSIVTKTFMKVDNFIQIAVVGTFLMAAASGETIVIITRNIDLSVGSVAYLTGAVMYVAAISRGLHPAICILFGILTGVITGLINGLLISYLKLNPLLTTLGLLISYRGLSLLLTGGTSAPVGKIIWSWGKIRVFNLIPLIFLISLILMIILQILLKTTRFGMYCQLIGNNELGAIQVGIPVKKIKLIVFTISGVCSAIAGVLIALYLGEISVYTGQGMEFDAIAAVVIGGTSLFGGRGNILPGTFAGILLLNIINNGLGNMGASRYLYAFISGVVIFIAIYLDSLKNYRRLSVY